MIISVRETAVYQFKTLVHGFWYIPWQTAWNIAGMNPYNVYVLIELQ
jgi:hypothetical protein